jgi:phosphatidylglycerol lysyltransferase
VSSSRAIFSPGVLEYPILKERPSISHAREKILDYAWNSTAYQILNPGIERWFARDKEAVVGFVCAKGVRVAVGAPVCGLDDLPAVAAEFENDASRHHQRVCYFGAESRLESLYKGSETHAKVLLGAQPVWDPADWPGIIASNKSLRAQLNRARNKGVTVTEWPIEKAHANPTLAECLAKWLASKGLPPLHFMVEPDTLERLFDRRVFVGELDGKVVGFIVLSPVPMRNGWLFEQFPHVPGAPNGTVELMIDTAMRALAADGFDYATLGLSPLSVRATVEPFDNPLWLKIVLAWLRKHARRFYDFDGLDAFKSKLKPTRWEPVFAISNEEKMSPRTLYAILAAFSQNKPFRLVVSGMIKALSTEIIWIKRKMFN